MKKDFRVYLDDVITSSNSIATYIREKTHIEFDENEEIQKTSLY